ncbi:Uncharacterised protein [Mycobacterium tuberculosis]|nr:Uncharacterised protein [Mycobacterium tuberculosis]COY85749.1 Uncharacterised protein [Mycobacterium tuberculosis]
MSLLIVLPGTGTSPVASQSRSVPSGYAISSGVSCCSAVSTTSVRVPR